MQTNEIGGVFLTSFVGFVIFPSGDEYYNGFLNPNGYQFLAIFGGLTCFLAAIFFLGHKQVAMFFDDLGAVCHV